MADGFIKYENVSKEFGDVKAVDDVSFEIDEGEFLALLGPSGAGKTTVLRMLAGFETPTEGRIILDGRDVTKTPPHKRDTGMVFQDYALFPHMTVKENIAFGLKQRGFSSEEIDAKVEEILSLVDLAGYDDRKPGELSGGQQQRIATARALAIEPKVLLMDEPLGALDKKLRDQLQIELMEIQETLGITTVYVTHNQDEALTMVDRVAVMNEGRIVQTAPPKQIYDDPATEFVADFIGDTNFLDGTLHEDGGEVVLRTSRGDVRVNATAVPDGNASVFVRPEKISLQSQPRNGRNTITGTVDQIIYLGSKIRYIVDGGDSEIVVDVQNDETPTQDVNTGDDVVLGWDKGDTHITRSY